MGFVRRSLRLEGWLDDHSESWSLLSDREYKALVKSWSTLFIPLIESGKRSFEGYFAIEAFGKHIPADVYLFSGIRIPQLLNNGLVAFAYRTDQLCELDRDLANCLDLVVVNSNMAWSCVYSHEAGSWVWEQFYDRVQ